MKRLLSRVAAGSVASVFVVANLSASAAAAAPLETRRPNSLVKSWTSTHKRTAVYNTNTLKLENEDEQDADSGKVWVRNTTKTGNATSGDAIALSDQNASVTNTIKATAESGRVTAVDNTTVGDTRTGNSETNVTILNLSSSSVVGSNALLVFMNVLGN